MKVLVLLSTLVLSVVAEPPAARSYLPPSSEYGPPSASSLSSQYGAPAANGLSTQYGAPSANGPSTQYGASALRDAAFGRSDTSSQSPAARVSSSFGRASSRRFGAGRRIVGGPSTLYGAPLVAGSAAGFGELGLSTQYGAPSYSGDALSAQYGAPSGNAGGLSPVYGVPGFGYGRAGGQEDSMAEPANYEFSYTVQDAASYNDFSHQETRKDENAQGEYRVLLPDGRVQVVSYRADEDGYHPTIQYEQTGRAAPAPAPGFGSDGYRY
ncbi:pro-resilin-like isoform X2 [Schistocerca gregaria]|uniref:pro-resilin-like isoform X2 n=1 Tax=Schistocerca gregaria TaxID=7010 RepID=UPI00211EC1FD|nr:pro-resilin-like isoform X2 [Schistocerca gregaria]